MNQTDVKKMLCGLDKTRVSQKISYDTAISSPNKKRSINGEISFGFSVLKGMCALAAACAAAALTVFAFKMSVEQKFLKKLKKKYRLVPIEKSENSKSAQ